MKVTHKAISLEEVFQSAQKAVLTVSDISRLTGFEPRYLAVALHRAVKSGLIRRIENGKYAGINTHPLAMASNILFPSYVSFLSAFNYYNLVNQMPSTISVASLKNRRPIKLDEYTVSFVAMRPGKIFGYERIQIDGKLAFVASQEKTIVDSLYLPAHCPISETWLAIQNGKFDINKMLEYAKKMDSIVTLKRLGFLFESAGADLFKQIGHLINRKKDPLNPLLPKKGSYNSKWRLIINEEVFR